MKKIIIFSTLLMVIFTSLAFAITTPSITPSTWSQNTKIVVDWTPVGGAADGDIDSVVIRLSSTLTANSSSSILLNRTNSTAENFNTKTNLNETFGMNFSVEDATNYAVTAILSFNGSETSSASTTVIVDRTAPATPTTLTTGTINNAGTISATVQGANVTTCTISFGLGGIRSPMTHSGNTCTFTVGLNNPSDGTYQYNVVASDGINSSTSATTEITIDAVANPARRSPSSLSAPVTQKAAIGMTGVQKFALGALIVVLADLFGGLGLIFKKR